MKKDIFAFSLQTAPRLTLACLSLALFLFALGCGGGGGNDVAPPPPPPSSTTTQVRIGDAASDRVLFFAIKVGSPLTLNTASGGKVLFDIGNNRWELTHTAGKFEPLAVPDVPQGTYSSVDFVVVSPGMVYLDSNGTPQGILGNPSQTVTVNFSPSLTIGSSPMILTMDLNVANSLALDTNGFVTGFDFKPSSFTFTTAAIPPLDQQEDATGEIEGTTGKVTAVTGSNFTIEVGQGNTELAFATDATTEFSGDITSLAGALNQIVKVEGYTKSDGTLFATEVEGMESQSGATLEGLATNMTPSTFELEVQDGNGNGMDPTKVGVLFSVDTSSLAASDYVVDFGNSDTAGLIPGSNFVFDASHFHIGQRVEVETVDAVPANGTVTANKVRLQQQALTGTVTNFVAGGNNSAQFDLNLPIDGSSYIGLLLAANTIHVYQQTGTHNVLGIFGNGDKVRVRGLLFRGTGVYNMIARRITVP
jgi:hypothetical protein